MEKTSFFKRPAVQTIVASVLCALLGILLGYVILCAMDAEHAFEGILSIMKNFFKFQNNPQVLMQNFGSFFVKSVPLILCAEAILFAYKAGLFNIGVAGQYTMGLMASLYCALSLKWSWILCVLAAVVVAGLWGCICGVFKAYFNVNEVIAGIMLNWIGLYLTNIILGSEKCMDQTKSETYKVAEVNPSGSLPSFLGGFFGDNKYTSIALIATVVVAIVILVVLNKTTFGYELKATGNNKEAAKYAGMNAKRNIILTLAISGAIAGFAASQYYLTGIESYKISSSVPGMGFSGIAVAFLGGLNPIGAIVAGLFVEYITLGGQYLNTNYYNPQVADLMVSIIIYLCGFVLFFKTVMNKPGKVKNNANAEPEKASEKEEV